MRAIHISNGKWCWAMLFIVTLVCIALIGCVHTYRPKKLWPVSLVDAGIMNMGCKVALLNAQTDNAQHAFLHIGPHPHQASYKEWTEAMVAHLKIEFEKRGVEVSISSSGEKVINLRIVQLNAQQHGWFMTFAMEVDTFSNEGKLKKSFQTSIRSAAVDRGLIGSVHEFCKIFLNDAEVLAYIQEE